MARRWRIRYKLLFGFGLILGIMALLLLATLRGLWSYYLTMNSIRSKHVEQKVAEELKEAVSHIVRLAQDPFDLLRRNEASRPIPHDDAPRPLGPALVAEGPEADQGPQTLEQAITLARHKLDDYQGELVRHGQATVHAEHQSGLVEELRQRLDALEQMWRNPPPQMGGALSTREMLEQARAAWREPVRRLELAAADLWRNIHEAENDHISQSRSHYQMTLWISVPTSIVGLLLICGLLRSFYAWVFYPIRDLGAGVSRVAHGDFTRKIEVHSGDEMEELAAAFNDMMQRLHDLYSDLAHQVNERSRQLVRSERLASVGFLAAGVAHEINNPLASIAFCSEALEARLADLVRATRPNARSAEEVAVFTKYLKMIQEEAFRCKNITESLLAFSRTSERRREPTDLRALVQSVLDVTQHLQNHRGKQITFEVADRAPGEIVSAWVNAEEIKSVVLNLVTNGLESMDEGGHLTIRLRQVGDRAELAFTDNGCGMTEEVLENIFEPFFTRSRTGKGTGLGLTISHRIIAQHGGEIEASSAGPNQGSTFVVRLPLRPPPEELEGPGADTAAPPAPRREPASRAA